MSVVSKGPPSGSSWEVVVVGAGPAGAATAVALARLGRRVALMDPVETPSFRAGECLPAAAGPLLEELGLASVLEGHLHGASRRLSWGREDLDHLDLLRDPLGPGWHLDRPRFDEALRDEVEALGVRRLRCRLRGLARAEGGGGAAPAWRLEDAEGGVHQARFLVEATGRRGAVARRLAGLGEAVQTRLDEPLLAWVRWVHCLPGDKDRTTLVEAVPEGWWYTAAVPGGARVVVLHCAPEEGPQGGVGLGEESVMDGLVSRTRRLREHVIGAEPLTRWRGQEASGGFLSPFGGPGWLAVGDAALRFDPLSSQGLFHGLYTGLRGAQAVHAALDGDAGPGLAYGRVLAEVRRRYRAHQEHYYGLEGRWPEAAFWRVRLAGGRSP